MSIGLTDSVAPLGAFPVLEDVHFKGGYQTSPSTVDRNDIPAANRKVGMLVYTIATSETWILGPGITNSDWVLTQLTPIGGVPVDVTKAAAAQGVSGAASRSDHKHDISTAAVLGLTHQATSSEGTATSVARSDHVHGFTAPAAPADVIVQTADAGVATAFARSDHLHNVATAAPTQGIGGANSAGSSTSLSRADHSHTLRTTTGPTDLTIGAIVDGEVLKRVGTAVVGFVIPGTAITVQEEGVTQSTTVNTFNFVGSLITASGGGSTATITVSLGAALGGSGGIVARRTVTGPTTVSVAATDHLILVDTTAGVVTLTLPDPATTDRIYEIKDIAGTFGTNACVLARNNGADQIEGLASNYLLEAAWQNQRIGSNGTTKWMLL